MVNSRKCQIIHPFLYLGRRAGVTGAARDECGTRGHMYLVRSPIQLARWRRQEAALLLQRASLALLARCANGLPDSSTPALFRSTIYNARPPNASPPLARGRLEA